MDAGLAALLGALIGFGGSLLLDIFRGERENHRWIRNEKRRVYSSILEALGKAIKDAKLSGDIGIPRVELWEVAKHLGELHLFTDQNIAQGLTDRFTTSIWEGDAEGFVDYMSIIRFNEQVIETAKNDLVDEKSTWQLLKEKIGAA